MFRGILKVLLSNYLDKGKSARAATAQDDALVLSSVKRGIPPPAKTQKTEEAAMHLKGKEMEKKDHGTGRRAQLYGEKDALHSVDG